eukprot:3769757-Pyramimonas_sp.AAC.3
MYAKRQFSIFSTWSPRRRCSRPPPLLIGPLCGSDRLRLAQAGEFPAQAGETPAQAGEFTHMTTETGPSWGGLVVC